MKRSSDHTVRIAVDLTPMLPGGVNGGVKPAIFAFIRSLRRLQDPRFEFLFLTGASTHAEVQAVMTDRDELVCLDANRGSEIRQPAFFRRRHVDLLYAPFGMISYPNCGIPMVAMVVDLLHRDYPFSISETEREWREQYFRQMVASADRFQVISDYTGERLMEHYRIPVEKIFRTYLPIQDRLKAAATDLSNDQRYFFYPANFWPHKNHEVLLIAYQIYRRLGAACTWKLVLTGSDDPRRKVLQELANTLGIEKDVIFKGHVSEGELAQLFSNAAALVFPSLHEGFGIPPIEAMKLGVPVLTSDSGSLREVVGESALKVDPRRPLELASAMGHITSSESLRETLRQRGFQRAQLFSLETEVARLAEVFREIVHSRKGRTWVERLARRFAPKRSNGSYSSSKVRLEHHGPEGS
jgi:glycosyltransferase involved in cell wall biosynthesis